MCCSAWPVHFSKTITGTWEVMVEDVLRHVIWYQNRVGGLHQTFGSGWGDESGAYQKGIRDQVFEVVVRQAIAGAPWEEICAGPMKANNIDPDEIREEVARRTGKYDYGKYDHGRSDHGRSDHGKVDDRKFIRKETGEEAARKKLASQDTVPVRDVDGGGGPSRGNCLIIPIMGSWESILLLNTADTPDLLSDIDKALAIPAPRAAGWGASLQEKVVAGGSAGRMVLMQFDVYDIVLAENASTIGKVLPQINEGKRPEVNPEVFDTLEKWYQCPVAVCCFKSDEEAEAKPIGFSFVPRDPSKLTVYTLDGHDGRAPDPDAKVLIDHTIFVGSYLTHPRFQAEVHYRDRIPDHLAPYLLKHAMGMPVRKEAINGDTVFDIEDVRGGFFSGVRELPPYAPPRKNSSPDHIFRDETYNNGNRSQVRMRGKT